MRFRKDFLYIISHHPVAFGAPTVRFPLQQVTPDLKLSLLSHYAAFNHKWSHHTKIFKDYINTITLLRKSPIYNSYALICTKWPYSIFWTKWTSGRQLKTFTAEKKHQWVLSDYTNHCSMNVLTYTLVFKMLHGMTLEKPEVLKMHTTVIMITFCRNTRYLYDCKAFDR